MKISILGTVVDTDNFHEVTPVEFTKYNDHEFGGWTSITSKEEATQATFSIVFKYGDKRIPVTLSLTPADKVKQLELVNKIIHLRDEIVKCWGDGTNIPEFNFDSICGNC